MKYITLPDQKEHRLAFYLAMEEYVARQLDEPDAFFLWQVAPSVIFGRNQVAENEVNLDYCREHGISVYRRKSGGGCVYADRDNLMWSFVTATENVGFAFNRFLNMVLLVLRKMGIEGVGTSHNDITLPPLSPAGSPPQAGGQGRKVCGTACYHVASHCIVHSTMLYDTNMTHMTNAISPPREKLKRKGVESVRQRITLLKDYTTLTLDEVKKLIRETLCDGERQLTDADVAAIEALEQTYQDEGFIKLYI
jgi:lipoic acid synthetase/lipoate-protein ligase A